MKIVVKCGDILTHSPLTPLAAACSDETEYFLYIVSDCLSLVQGHFFAVVIWMDGCLHTFVRLLVVHFSCCCCRVSAIGVHLLFIVPE